MPFPFSISVDLKLWVVTIAVGISRCPASSRRIMLPAKLVSELRSAGAKISPKLLQTPTLKLILAPYQGKAEVLHFPFHAT